MGAELSTGALAAVREQADAVCTGAAPEPGVGSGGVRPGEAAGGVESRAVPGRVEQQAAPAGLSELGGTAGVGLAEAGAALDRDGTRAKEKF